MYDVQLYNYIQKCITIIAVLLYIHEIFEVYVLAYLNRM